MFDTEFGLAHESLTIVDRRAVRGFGQLALRWILSFPELTTTIPGARTAAQAESNVRAAELPPPSEELMAKVREVYDMHFRASVHGRW